MSDDNHWREKFRAKTVIDEIAVEKTIERTISKYGDKYPLLAATVDALRWRLARGYKDENSISASWDQEYRGKECFLAKVEMEIPKGYIIVLFVEDENEVTLIDIEFIIDDSDDSSVVRPLFKNKS